MTRPVDEADVLALIPGTTLTSLAPFISAAYNLVNKLAVSSCGSVLTESELEVIETWVAAHFASISDPKLNITSEKVEGSQITINKGNSGSMSGIMSTVYGQTANTLSNGCLDEITKPVPTLVFF